MPYERLTAAELLTSLKRRKRSKRKRSTKPRPMSTLELAFSNAWRLMVSEIPLVSEHYFDEERDWRFDFAHLPTKVAIEIQGGTFIRGGHSRGMGQHRDMEKNNAATLAGWRMVLLDCKMLGKKKIVATVEKVLEIIKEAGR